MFRWSPRESTDEFVPARHSEVGGCLPLVEAAANEGGTFRGLAAVKNDLVMRVGANVNARCLGLRRIAAGHARRPIAVGTVYRLEGDLAHPLVLGRIRMARPFRMMEVQDRRRIE